MDNRLAAAQLATMLLVVVLALLHLEHRAQKRMRFAASGVGRAGSSEAQPLVLRGGLRVAAWLVCGLPVLMGFVAPIAFMLRPLAADWSVLPWGRFVEWAWHSVRLGGITSALAVAVALTLAFAVRRRPDGVTRGVVQLASPGLCGAGGCDCGGLLLPVGWLQAAVPQWGIGALVTATAVGIVWAYLVRFCAVACSRCKAAMRAFQPAWTIPPACWAWALGLMARVHWPLLRRSTAAAALLVFVDVMKELPATMVLRPSTATPWPWWPTSWPATSAWAKPPCHRWRWWRWAWCR